MEAKIKQLVETTPNDNALGAAVRALYWAERSMNEVKDDPNQLTLDQLINESHTNN